MKFTTLPNFTGNLLLIFLIFILISSGFSSITDAPKQCATFQSSILLPGETLSLQDGAIIGNFAEEFATSKKTWNIPGTWQVSTGCELQVCTGAYLGGSCKNLTQQSSSESSAETQLSASCTCQEECSCVSAEIIQLKSICARAYFHPRGCNNCNSEYTELSNSSENNFPESWRNRARSFLINPLCTLTIYDEEEYDGEAEVERRAKKRAEKLCQS